METGAIRSARYELTTTHFVSNLMGAVQVFLYWIEPFGQEFLLFGAVEPRKVQEACRFSGLDPNTTVMSVSERHFSKKLLALWMASYVKQKAVVLARYYRQHGDVAHKVVEKHVPLRSEL